MPLFKKKKLPTPPLDDQFRHIAFIMDGNGRWAKSRGMPREYGHKAGSETFRALCRYCFEAGFSAVTVYAFSTENWKRPEPEVAAIMDLLTTYLDELLADTSALKVRIRFIGDLTPLPEGLRAKIENAHSLCPDSNRILNIALNYGGRAELAHAFETLAREGRTAITEADISAALYTAESGDPDMIVRTGGDLRLSNFLLWQAAYSEFYFTKTLWPDLTPADIDAIIREFYSRKRRYGGL